jgi:hypothetical protein
MARAVTESSLCNYVGLQLQEEWHSAHAALRTRKQAGLNATVNRSECLCVTPLSVHIGTSVPFPFFLSVV